MKIKRLWEGGLLVVSIYAFVYFVVWTSSPFLLSSTKIFHKSGLYLSPFIPCHCHLISIPTNFDLQGAPVCTVKKMNVYLLSSTWQWCWTFYPSNTSLLWCPWKDLLKFLPILWLILPLVFPGLLQFLTWECSPACLTLPSTLLTLYSSVYYYPIPLASMMLISLLYITYTCNIYIQARILFWTQIYSTAY